MKNIIIVILFLLPVSLSAQLLRSYGVVEIGSTFPTSTITGAKFAYRTVDSSYYRWVSGNTWVKIIEPSIIPDTLYITEEVGTSYKISGDTLHLTPYLLKSDTSAMLVKYIERGDTLGMLSAYIRSAGWGLLKSSYTLRADSTLLATRLFTKNLPTYIANTQIAYSNGNNLVGSSNFIWDNSSSKLTVLGNLRANNLEVPQGGVITFTGNYTQEYIYQSGIGVVDNVSRGTFRFWTDTNNNDGSPENEFAVYTGLSPQFNTTGLTPMFTIKKDNKIGVLVNSPAYILDINSTDALRLPRGTTAQQPTSAFGLLRGNTTNSFIEANLGSGFENVVTSTGASANQMSYFTNAGRIAGNSRHTINPSTGAQTITLDNSSGQADILFNATSPLATGNNNWGLRYNSNNQLTFGHISGARIWWTGAGAQGALQGTWSIAGGTSYNSPMNMVSNSSSSNDVRLVLLKTGDGANQLIHSYTQRYAVNDDPPRLMTTGLNHLWATRKSTTPWATSFDTIRMALAQNGDLKLYKSTVANIPTTDARFSVQGRGTASTYPLIVGENVAGTDRFYVLENGDGYIDNLFIVGGSLRVINTPAHTSASGIAIFDANNWVGKASFSGGLIYSGGVLSSRWLGTELPTGDVQISSANNSLRLNSLDTMKMGNTIITGGVIGSTGNNTSLLLLNPNVGSSGTAFNTTGYHTNINGTINGVNVGTGHIVIGGSTVANGYNFMTNLGYQSLVGGNYAIGLGYDADATNDNAMAIGYGARADESGEISLGSNNYTKLNLWAGGTNGVVNIVNYGLGNREATDLSKTQSNYLAAYATDNTLVELGIGSGLKRSGGVLDIKRKSLIDSLPLASVAIDAVGNNLSFNALGTFTVDFNTTAGSIVSDGDITTIESDSEIHLATGQDARLDLTDEAKLAAPNLEGENSYTVGYDGFYWNFVNEAAAELDSAFAIITDGDRKLIRAHGYGNGYVDATYTGEYPGKYILATTANHNVMDYRIDRDTLVIDANLSVGTLLYYTQNLHINLRMTALASTNSTITFPDAAEVFRGKSIYVRVLEKDPGIYVPVINVSGGVSRLLYTSTTTTAPADQATLTMDNSTWPFFRTYKFTCLNTGTTPNYRWVLQN